MISDGKPSAIFKVSATEPFDLGISIEGPEFANQLLPTSQPGASGPAHPPTTTTTNSSIIMAVVKNLYNHIMSFNVSSDTMIPLQVFVDWYNNLLRKVSLDPNYLCKSME